MKSNSLSDVFKPKTKTLKNFSKKNKIPMTKMKLSKVSFKDFKGIPSLKEKQ